MTDLTLIIIIFLILVTSIVIFYLIKKNDNKAQELPDFTKHEDNLIRAISRLEDNMKRELDNATKNYSEVKEKLGEGKSLVDERTKYISGLSERLLQSISGSKRMGMAGELMLRNILDHSGLVKGKQWIENQNYKKDGKTLNVEFGIVHPTGLIMPIDSHFPSDLYSQLNNIRSQPVSDERDNLEKSKFIELVKVFGEKAKSVSQKYLGHEISANFACVYIPSESLYLEINTHVAETKELWISEIHKKYKVIFLGPSTFSAYISAILLGFNSIAVEEKALLFLKYMEKFKGLLKDHYEDLAKLQNKIESITKGSADASRSGEKIKNELEKIEHELKEINKKS
jgi:DNA recombination protein RmuC|tara:strand:- start:259 stop:1284 length:1026 start_codon:yes stop_codon:yes gene_type:complete